MRWSTALLFGTLLLLLVAKPVRAQEEDVEEDEEKPYVLPGMTAEESESLRNSGERFEFQAEVSRMLKLIVNSLYKNKEIFLRELISNASDALDKIRFLSLTDKTALDSKSELDIHIKADKEANTLTIIDAGVGMTKQHLVQNLGTIAKSGTAEFLKNMDHVQSDSMGLIGQFGVGFYSAFLVADVVTVVSKHNDDEQYIWESTVDGSFKVFRDPRGNTLGRGTSITLHMKPEASDFLEDHRLEALVQKYSEFINFPIYLWKARSESVTVDLTDEELEEMRESRANEKKAKVKKLGGDDDDDEEDVVVEEDEDIDDEELPTTKTVQQTVTDFVVVNENKPIWIRDPTEVSQEEYDEFYKAFTKDKENPLSHTHFKAEGEVEFRSILYVPSRPPNNMYSVEDNQDSIRLYVRRVFITDTDSEKLLPKYLKFIKGLVDSDDLPLNVSRETLQQHKMLRVIKKKLTRKALEMIKSLSEDEDKYKEFLGEFGTALKWGVIEDDGNRNRLASLLRFHTSKSEDDSEQVSLETYVSRMKKGQDSLFFLAGNSLREIRESPFVERLLARGYEVLYMPDPIDESMVQALVEYDGYRFQNIAKDGLRFGDEDDEEKERKEILTEKFEPLTAWMKNVLSEQVFDVVITNRLTTSPCALVSTQYGWSGNMERIMKAQAYLNQQDTMASYYLKQKKTMEINPKHPVIERLLQVVEADAVDTTTEQLAMILFDTAAMRSGYQVKDINEFATHIENIVRTNLGVALDLKVEVDEKPAPEYDPEDDAETAEEDDDDVVFDHDEL